MIEKKKNKKVVKGGGYGNYYPTSSRQQYQQLHTSSSSTEPDRCSKTTNYFPSDNYSELLSHFKFNNETINAIKKYNELLNQYNNGAKTGLFSKPIVCKNISSYKNSNKSRTCKTLNTNKENARTNVLNEISKYIKTKINKRLTKIQRNPKTKRLNKISCNIKLYIDLLNSSNCRHGKNKDYNISKLITDLKAKFPQAPEFAEAYINNMMKKRDTASESLKKIQLNDNFSKELKNVIKSYPDKCSS